MCTCMYLYIYIYIKCIPSKVVACGFKHLISSPPGWYFPLNDLSPKLPISLTLTEWVLNWLKTVQMNTPDVLVRETESLDESWNLQHLTSKTQVKSTSCDKTVYGPHNGWTVMDAYRGSHSLYRPIHWFNHDLSGSRPGSSQTTEGLSRKPANFGATSNPFWWFNQHFCCFTFHLS